MKKINIIILGIVVLIVSMGTQAANYTLKRAIITWAGPVVDDSYLGDFQVFGSMSINGMEIVQSIRFCIAGACENLVENTGGTIISISQNTAKITSRRHQDGVIDDLTILSLLPNIITLYVYDDGTVETHEWRPVNAFAISKEQIPDDLGESGQVSGQIGRGIAEALRPGFIK